MQAKYTDCHLSHDAPVRHIVAKAHQGLNDVWAQWAVDTDSIDWAAKRRHRHRYGYE